MLRHGERVLREQPRQLLRVIREITLAAAALRHILQNVCVRIRFRSQPDHADGHIGLTTFLDQPGVIAELLSRISRVREQNDVPRLCFGTRNHARRRLQRLTHDDAAALRPDGHDLTAPRLIVFHAVEGDDQMRFGVHGKHAKFVHR